MADEQPTAANTHTVRLPDGHLIKNVPEGMTQVELLGHLQRAKHPSAETLMKHMASQEALMDIGPNGRFQAGGGLAFRNLGRTVLGRNEDYQEHKRMDRELMATPSGASGNIVSNLAMFAPTAAIPGANTATGAGLIGGTIALTQPTDSIAEKAKNFGTGAMLGWLPQWGATTGAKAVGEWAAKREAGAALKASQNAVRDQTLKAGQEAGYVLPPSAVSNGFIAKRLESVGGKAAVGQEAALRNQPVTDTLARQAAGLRPEQEISRTNLRQSRYDQAAPYREIAGLSPQAAADLEALQLARHDSRMAWKEYNRQGVRTAYNDATAADARAKALEKALEGHAQTAGRPDLVKSYIEARKGIAQNRQVQDATNVGTGSVDASVLGRALDSGAPLSGNLETIARFQQAYKPYMREASTIPTPGVSKTEALSSALMAGAGQAATPGGWLAGGLPLLSGPARSMLLSGPVQKNLHPNYSPGFMNSEMAALADPQTREKAAAIARALMLPAIPQVTGQ